MIEQRLGLIGLQPGGADTTNDLGKQLRSITTNLTGGERPGLLVQRAIREIGHCEFTPNEVGKAWDDLTTWVESRQAHSHHGHRAVVRPAGDDVLTPATVASPTYGCQFTDPTAYRTYPTRKYYAPCPGS